MDIHFEQAAHDFNRRRVVDAKNSKEEIAAAISEIMTSDFGMYDAADINYLAGIAGITPNEARRLNMQHSGFEYDVVNTFANDETDSIFDFF